jgi:hypothetical protein
VLIENDAVTVSVAITMVAVLENDGVTIPAVIALSNHGAVVIPIRIAVAVTMAGSDGHADRPHPNADFIRASRHGAADASNCRYHQSVSHSCSPQMAALRDNRQEPALVPGKVKIRE